MQLQSGAEIPQLPLAALISRALTELPSERRQSGMSTGLGCPELPALQGFCCLLHAYISELHHTSSLQQEGTRAWSGIFPSVQHQWLPVVSTTPGLGEGSVRRSSQSFKKKSLNKII